MSDKKMTSGAGHVPPSLLKQVVGKKVNRCFGCGPGNAHGLKLRFKLDHANNSSMAKVKLLRQFEGPPGHIHGGILATLMDEAMGKVNKIFDTVSMTRHMEISYLRPSPLGVTLTVTGRFVKREGRKMFMEGEIRNASGDLLVHSKGLFIQIDPVALFARHSTQRIRAACPVAVPATKPRTARKSQ